MKYFKISAPFLMAIFTVTSLWSANAERINPGQMWTPIIFSFILAGLFLLLAWLFPPTSRNAGIVATFFVVAFLLGSEIGWWALFLILTGLILGIYKRLDKLQQHISVIIPIALVIVLPVTLVQGYLNHDPDNIILVDYERSPGKPNIYFIVPDRMPSPDAMRETGINPDSMIDNLEVWGFIVPDNMQSEDEYQIGDDVNTTRTMRFFASVLNLGMDIPLNIEYSDARDLIKDSYLFELLHDKGYSITNIGSWFYETASFPTADENLRYDDVSFMERIFYDELSLAYFNRTIIAGLNFRVWESDDSIKNIEEGRHDWQFERLVDIASSGETSQFVISHILLPHEPFIYSDRSNKFDRYLDQIEYAEIYIMELVQEIRRLDPTAFIIIQSDEGMAFRSPVELNEGLSQLQWNGVFSAWYFPCEIDIPEGLLHTQILDLVLTKLE